MNLDEFDYPLPLELIADRPVPARSESRLLVVSRATATLEHRVFRDLPEILYRNDLLVINRSKVIPARLLGTKRGGGARIEILLLERRKELLWECIAQRAIRLSAGTVIAFSERDVCVVREALGEGRFVLEFQIGETWEEFLARHGSTPLPPYILKKRETLPEAERAALESLDKERYQTRYAVEPGSAAAPTAGLHFDESVLEALKRGGIESAPIVLHVGLDTFSPVTVERVEDHVMKSEWCDIPPDSLNRIVGKLDSGSGRVVAVGTTACRTLESYARAGWPEGPLRTELFLKPGDSFLATQALITNFHLPKSTLLMLVSAFMGNELRKRAYDEAVRERYRFYSYGDAMLIL